MERGHGRGNGKRTTRCREQEPCPVRDRVVTPPSTNEVAREGDKGEEVMIQEKKVPPSLLQRR